MYTQAGMEYLDPWVSRAFAVADHQVAHVYIDDDADIPRVRDMLASLPGVDEVLDRSEQAKYGIDHERSGELVVVADPDAWFTYYYWLDDERAPDFARGVEIHRKPGYDPAELFFNPADIPAVAKLCAGLPGVAEVLDAEGQAAHGLDHERSGELVLVAEPDAWFTYYYWLDDAAAPDFARLVEIHRKPGYDPAELFFDPAAPGAAKRRAGLALLRKKLGFRYLMTVVGLDAGARAVKGSHGRLPDDPRDAPVLICSDRSAATGAGAATEGKDLLLRLAGARS